MPRGEKLSKGCIFETKILLFILLLQGLLFEPNNSKPLDSDSICRRPLAIVGGGGGDSGESIRNHSKGIGQQPVAPTASLAVLLPCARAMCRQHARMSRDVPARVELVALTKDGTEPFPFNLILLSDQR